MFKRLTERKNKKNFEFLLLNLTCPKLAKAKIRIKPKETAENNKIHFGFHKIFTRAIENSE
jgi:hypothetical protein